MSNVLDEQSESNVLIQARQQREELKRDRSLEGKKTVGRATFEYSARWNALPNPLRDALDILIKNTSKYDMLKSLKFSNLQCWAWTKKGSYLSPSEEIKSPVVFLALGADVLLSPQQKLSSPPERSRPYKRKSDADASSFSMKLVHGDIAVVVDNFIGSYKFTSSDFVMVLMCW